MGVNKKIPNKMNQITHFALISKKREVVTDLAPMLWNSFGTIAALLQEIVSIYPSINPPNLSVRIVVVTFKNSFNYWQLFKIHCKNNC